MNKQQWRNGTDMKNRNKLGQNQSQRHLIHHKSHTCWTQQSAITKAKWRNNRRGDRGRQQYLQDTRCSTAAVCWTQRQRACRTEVLNATHALCNCCISNRRTSLQISWTELYFICKFVMLPTSIQQNQSYKRMCLHRIDGTECERTHESRKRRHNP
jgi:hypothetical protein